MIDITLVAPHAADIESASKTEISILARPNTTTKRQQMHKIEIKQERYVQIVTGIQSSISRHVINQWTNRIEISDRVAAVHLGANSGYPSFLEQHGIHTSRSNSSEKQFNKTNKLGTKPSSTGQAIFLSRKQWNKWRNSLFQHHYSTKMKIESFPGKRTDEMFWRRI